MGKWVAKQSRKWCLIITPCRFGF